MKAREIKQKGIEVNLDKTRRLVFDLNAFAELEEKYGTLPKAFEALQTGSIKAIRFLLWAGLVHEDEGLTEKDVGTLVDLNNIGDISNKIAEALADAMPEENKSAKNK